MGSSAASAAAACWAVNTLLGTRLTKQQCVLAGLKSEEAVSGYHADNIGPALLGGFTLIRWNMLSELRTQPMLQIVIDVIAASQVPKFTVIAAGPVPDTVIAAGPVPDTGAATFCRLAAGV